MKTSLLFAILIIGIALLAYALITFYSYVPPNPSPTTALPSPSPASVQNPQSTIVSNDRLEQDWSLINNESVERACLAEAKRQARTSGYGDSVVFSCSCKASESSDFKSYDCQVSALDGNHPVAIACTKNRQSCEITSEQGIVVYTFEQLRILAGS